MRHYFFAVLLFAVACCGGLPAGPRAGDIVKITGRVHDFSTGAAVAASTVTFGSATAVTNASGDYEIAVSALEPYYPMIDGVSMGVSIPFASSYRGDFLIRGGTCVARYGVVSDLGLHRPIAGATVVLDVTGLQTTTSADGWYRIDAGCPSSGQVGSNTSAIRFVHPNYVTEQRIQGRGFTGVFRIDMQMQRSK